MQTNQGINRVRFTPEFIKKIRKLHKENRQNAFMRKYKPEFGDKYIWVEIDGERKKIVPEKRIENMLKNAIETMSYGIGIRTLQEQLGQKYVGVTRAMITKYLQADETLQKMRTRPAAESRKRDAPGKTEWVLKEKEGVRRGGGQSGVGYFDGLNTIGADLIEISKETFPPNWEGGKYIGVFVHKFSSYTWLFWMKDSSSLELADKLTRVAKSCTKRFGRCKHLETDSGSEMVGVTSRIIKTLGIHHSTLKLVSYVERQNSHIQRHLAFLADKGRYSKSANKLTAKHALDLTAAKINNTPNSVTKYRPKDINKSNIDQIVRKQPGQQARKLRKRENQKRKRRGLAPIVVKKRKPKKFKVGDLVRVLRKIAGRKAPIYKSYQITGTHRKWSEPTKILRIHRVNKDRYFVKTKIKKVMKEVWRDAKDLLLVKRAVQKPPPKHVGMRIPRR